MLEAGRDQRAQILRFDRGGDVPCQALPGIARAFDDFDGVRHRYLPLILTDDTDRKTSTNQCHQCKSVGKRVSTRVACVLLEQHPPLSVGRNARAAEKRGLACLTM